MQQRRALEHTVEREARLRRLRVNQQDRLAAETPEEREARLRRLRVNDQQRLAAETPEEREARLRRVHLSQQQRQASETAEETQARHLYDRQRHLQHSQEPLFRQQAVHTKMNKFHATMATLQVSTCVTCMETFPGLTVRATAAGTECVRCNRDKHNPKVYSCENNMHPGPIPQELLVRYAVV